MTIFSSKKPSSNNRETSANPQQQQQQQPSSLTRTRLPRDDEQATASSLASDTALENVATMASLAASASSPTTAAAAATTNDASSMITTSPNGHPHSKRKSHYQYHHLPQTLSKQARRRPTSIDGHLASSSNSDSSNDDSLLENSTDVGHGSATFTSKTSVPKKPSERTDQYNSEDEYDSTTPKYDRNNLNEHEVHFAQALKEKKGFIIKPVKEDGACLFRAVSDQVFGDEEMHSTVRENCMDYIVKNADFFRAYITEDFDRYVTRKRRENCHGNHIEMIALSELYNRPIEVYEYSLEPINVVQGMYKTDNEPIRLSYHCSVHYNSIVDPWRPTAGHGLGLPDLQPGHAQESLIVTALRQSEESHIERTMLDDKLAATDWEATQDALLQQIARESYLQWLCEKNQQSKDNLTGASSSASATTSEGFFNGNAENTERDPLPLKLDERTDCEFALPFNYDSDSATNPALADDDDSLMEQILAISRIEYVENLKKQSQSSKSGDADPSSSSDNHLL